MTSWEWGYGADTPQAAPASAGATWQPLRAFAPPRDPKGIPPLVIPLAGGARLG